MKKIVFVLSLAFFNFQNSYGQVAGTVDSSFGTNGFANGMEEVFVGQFGATLIQTDNKIICVQRGGNSNNYEIVMARFLSDGTLDNSFGINGSITNVTTAIKETPFCGALQSDGKILVGAFSENSSSAFGTISRFKTDGTADSTFGINGIVVSQFPGANSNSIYGLAVLPNGKIIAGGNTATGASQKSCLIRLNQNGSLDSTYAVNGRAIGNNMLTFCMNLQTDGKILLGGRTAKMAVTRFNTDGSIDSTFGTNGLCTALYGTTLSFANSVFELTDGSIVAGGSFQPPPSFLHSQFMAAKFFSNGKIDSTYGSNGIALDSIPSAYISLPTAGALQIDNKMIIVGGIAVDSATGYRFAMVRFNSNGTIDNSFGNNGMAITMDDGKAYPNSIAIASDNKILLGGLRIFGTQPASIAVARYGAGIVNTIPNLSSPILRFTVYPNPASIELVIDYAKFHVGDEIKILDLNERVMEKKILNNKNENFSVSNLSNGIYFIQVIAEKKSFTQKIIVQH